MIEKLTDISSTIQKPYYYWLKKNWYYHFFVTQFYQWAVEPGSVVLQIGCKTGYILDAVKPRIGVGVEAENECRESAQQQFSCYQFVQTIPEINDQKFDYIILSSTLMETEDIQLLLLSLQRFCSSHTRIIIDGYSFLWEPLLWCAQKCGLRRQTIFKNWLSQTDIENFLYLSNFEKITNGRRMLFPWYIPGISYVLNRLLAYIPLVNRLCLIEWTIARSIAKKEIMNPTVSVIVPCRNERGTIETIVTNMPQFGQNTEIIFVEGHSTDGTLNEIERVASLYPEKNVRCFVQTGADKGDAVRLGFSMAHNDILMIFDGDNTVPMHELPLFVQALIIGKGELINGSRFVYAMETGATRFLNVWVNYCFSLGFSWLLGQSVEDTLCGTKVLLKKDYERIARNRSYFGEVDPFSDFDLLFGAAKLQLKIVDIPVHYKRRTYGSPQVRYFYHGFILLRMWFFALGKFKF
ncbi:MAG: Poly-beta-1,6-N-acetyl-D-glucosamine synthase [Candidatus Dependentiae bacterium ADurb.Bin331]|nr:MAG: Poly-beta-1,6-N-acetyl-D-glucosamine synthase [Candidatus Dependentiae bacterium ADurb.Bin331]